MSFSFCLSRSQVVYSIAPNSSSFSLFNVSYFTSFWGYVLFFKINELIARIRFHIIEKKVLADCLIIFVLTQMILFHKFIVRN